MGGLGIYTVTLSTCIGNIEKFNWTYLDLYDSHCHCGFCTQVPGEKSQIHWPIMAHRVVARLGGLLLLTTITAPGVCGASTPPTAFFGVGPILLGGDGAPIQSAAGATHSRELPGRQVTTQTRRSRRLVLRPEDGEALSGITFSFQNTFNSTTEPILFNKESINLCKRTQSFLPAAARRRWSLTTVRHAVLME